MIFSVRNCGDVDKAETAFGPLLIEMDVYASRSVTAEEFGGALLSANQMAWQSGRDEYVYSRAEAQRDGVVL